MSDNDTPFDHGRIEQVRPTASAVYEVSVEDADAVSYDADVLAEAIATEAFAQDFPRCSAGSVTVETIDHLSEADFRVSIIHTSSTRQRSPDYE